MLVKRVLSLPLLLLSVLPLHSQSLTCDTGEALHAPFTLTAPDVRQGEVSLGSVFTIGAQGDAQPLALLSFDDAGALCVDSSGQLLTLAQDEVFVAYNAVVTSALDPAENRLRIGTSGTSGAELVIAVESPAFDTPHEYTLEVTPQMRASGIPLVIAAYALEGEAPPTLEVLDGRGRVAEIAGEALRCAGGIGRCRSLVGSGVYTLQSALTGQPTDPAIALDLAEWPFEEVRFRVSATPHLLLIRVANDAPAASGAQLIDGQGLICDGVPAWTAGVGLHFPDADEITVTALGDGFSDPVLAANAAQPRCNLNSLNALLYSLELPDAFVPVQDTSAQIALQGDEMAYVGLRDDASGTLYLVIEGLNVAETGQTIEIYPTAAMANAGDFLTVWAAAADDALDPVITWITDDGLPILDGFLEPYTCDNAGVPESCHGVSTSLRGARLTLRDGQPFLFTSEDAVLTIPVFPQSAEDALRLHLTGANNTTGPALLVLKLVIGG